MGTLLVIALVAAAVALTRHPTGKSYAFTVWVFAFVAASMVHPVLFMKWSGWDLKFLIVPLIQIIMFGMGTTLSLSDFTRVLSVPGPVIIGIALQYTVMPLVGYGLTLVYGFEPEVAAGVVLIGSAPGGVASNVINYLARCNVALSVTLTAISTLVSPIMTPLMMKLLAGRYVEISFLKMMVDIFNMIIVPIVAGLAAHRMLYGNEPRFRRAGVLAGVALAFLLLAFATALVPEAGLGGLRGGLCVGFAMVGVVALAKLIMDHAVRGRAGWMDRALPVVSMFAICLIIAIITARSSEDLKRVGLALLSAAMLHNLLGYALGYGGARLFGLNIVDARTVAVEVGMQNGGMASGLAMNTLHSAKAALAAAIFGPWQNVSGSILASWWRRRLAPAQPPSTPSSTPTP